MDVINIGAMRKKKDRGSHPTGNERPMLS